MLLHVPQSVGAQVTKMTSDRFEQLSSQRHSGVWTETYFIKAAAGVLYIGVSTSCLLVPNFNANRLGVCKNTDMHASVRQEGLKLL